MSVQFLIGLHCSSSGSGDVNIQEREIYIPSYLNYDAIKCTISYKTYSFSCHF